MTLEAPPNQATTAGQAPKVPQLNRNSGFKGPIGIPERHRDPTRGNRRHVFTICSLAKLLEQRLSVCPLASPRVGLPRHRHVDGQAIRETHHGLQAGHGFIAHSQRTVATAAQVERQDKILILLEDPYSGRAGHLRLRAYNYKGDAEQTALDRLTAAVAAGRVGAPDPDALRTTCRVRRAGDVDRRRGGNNGGRSGSESNDGAHPC